MALVLNGSANTIGGLAVGGLPDSVVDTDMIAAEAVTGAKVANGGIIQVVQAVNTGTAAQDCGTNTWYAGLSFNCAITPSTNSNKIIVTYSLSIGTESVPREVAIKPTRGGSVITSLIGDAGGSRTQAMTSGVNTPSAASCDQLVFTILDAPATTSECVYGFQHATMSAGCWTKRNYSMTDTDNASFVRAISTITAMEVVA